LMYMPIGIFGVSVATAAIPDLARHAADESHHDMRTTLSWGLRLMLMLSVPATVGLMVLAPSVVLGPSLISLLSQMMQTHPRMARVPGMRRIAALATAG